jgi:hypothetical protein
MSIKRQPVDKELRISMPKSFKSEKDPITGLNKGISLYFECESFKIDPSELNRAALGLGNCKSAINKGASREEAFLYQYKSGELFFNQNGSKSGFGKGGLICILSGAPEITDASFLF